jgi:hypothetical protein
VDNFVSLKNEAMNPLLAQAGAGLFDAQGLEYGVALLMYYIERLNPTESLPKIEAILDNKDKKTFGQLIRMLDSYVQKDPELEHIFREALDARNDLIHRLLIDNAEHFPSLTGRREVLAKIKAARSAMGKADAVIRPLIAELGLKLGDFDPAAYITETKANFKPGV